MNNAESGSWFDDIEVLVDRPDDFKKMLAIGEDAYTIFRLKNKVTAAWDAVGAAGTAAAAAQSSTVATIFFAPKGLLAVIGIGTASTPVGWVIAAGVVGGGVWWGISQYMNKAKKSCVVVIPEFINTPLDVLALGLFDLLAPLALKVAAFDGNISDSERSLIKAYFIKEWGYNERFVDEGLKFSESRLSELTIKELTETLTELTALNRDCNYDAMSENIINRLIHVTEADGIVCEQEELAIRRIKEIFSSNDPSKINNRLKRSQKYVTSKVNKVKGFIIKKMKNVKTST